MRVLVTGGGGFLGKEIIITLLKSGSYDVVSIGRSYAKSLDSYGVEILQGDLSDPAIAKSALKGIDVVFHVAAKAGIWGKWEDFYKCNFIATRNLLSSAKSEKVKYFIYTSTPSVVSGLKDIDNGNELLPYSSYPLCHYVSTKIMAEKLVLEFNNENCKTIALRPHLIWGKGDPHLVPTLLERAKRNRLCIIGNGQNRVDLTHVSNAAMAHILALKALMEGRASGKAYFVSDQHPVYLWEWINHLLRELKLKPVTRSIPFKIAYAVGFALEKLYTFSNTIPPLTRFAATQLAKSHYFDPENIQKDLNYYPLVSPNEALESYIKELREKH